MNFLLKYIILLLFLHVSLNAQNTQKISLQLLWKHQFEFAGFYMAKEKGYYKNLGLEVEIKEFTFGVNIVDDVLSAKSDIGIGRSSLILNKLQGLDIVLLDAIYQTSPYALLSKKRSDLKSVEDFKNKKIMLSDDLASIAAISSMMKIKNIKESDYTVLPHSFNIDDIIDGKVDIITTYTSNEPFVLKEKGVEFSIFDPKDYGFNFYADIIFTSQQYLKQKPQNIKKFREASLKGWNYAFNNIEETVALILKKYNSQNKNAEALTYEAKILKALALEKDVAFGTIDESRIKEIANIYRLLGMTNSPNKVLENLVYKEETFTDFMKRFFTLELFLGILFLIFVGVFLSYYKQRILKKQNNLLEDIIDAKTKELQLANEGLEQKVLERTQELEHALRAKSDFLANMSHEIRTPLNGIIGFIDILYKDEIDEKKLKKLAVVKESSHLLLHIINDILDYSKIQSKKVSIEKVPIDLHHVFIHVVDLFYSKAKERGITLELHIDKDLPQKTLGDSTRLKQIFSNLLSNAIKFSNENKEVTINLKYLKQTNELYCEVIDQGQGISEENIQNIFHSFEQADNSVTRIHGGTGLGLAISKSLVEYMGGNITVESTLDKGSKFVFSIKLYKTQDEITHPHSNNLEKNMLTGDVLIVEDNKTNQMLLTMLLDDLELEVDVANDGLEALEAVKNKCYDIILMDENMPNMNGKEAARIIRTYEEYKNTPIIAVTANALKGDKETFLEAGMNDYLSKPIDADALTLILCKYLG